MKRRIQSKLEALAHPDIRSNEDWLELRLTWRRGYVCCTPQLTKKTKPKSRGSVQTQVLSRYHRPTQNRKQYISSNIINRLQYSTCSNTSTIIINKYRQVHTWGLTPQYHTHLGIRFIRLSILTSFKIHYLYSSRVGTWHSDPHHTILVSERDTLIPYYYVSERDTPIP